MKIKKVFIMLSTIFLFLAIVSLKNTVFAEDEIYLGINEVMQENEDEYVVNNPSITNGTIGYSIKNPFANGTGGGSAAKIWNIQEYTSDADDALLKANGKENIFCVKAGVGFSNTNSRQTYDRSYNMMTQRNDIKSQNEILRELVEEQITINGNTVNRYNALLAALDMLYLPAISEEEQKEQILNTILNYARQPANGYTSYVGLIERYPLTSNDIKAVQQSALWYFTNFGETVTVNSNEIEKFNLLEDHSWLWYTFDGANYSNLANYTPNNLEQQYDAGQARSYQAEILYKLIIDQAIANASNYDSETSTIGAPAQLETETLNYIANGNNYIIGPIKITENQQNTSTYGVNLIVKNNNVKIDNYTFLNKNKAAINKQVEEDGTAIEDLVGEDFYIVVPKNSATDLELDFSINYNSKILTLWASSQDGQAQPVVIPELKPETAAASLTVQPKEFDLALRKYITKVNEVELTEANTRRPNIFISELNTIKNGELVTTATYKHRKDAIQVETGDIVRYNITIYNEGETDGRATEIVDQLPLGLEFRSIVEGNYIKAEDNGDLEVPNAIKFIRKENNKTNLSPFTSGNSSLDSETLVIECTVTAEPIASDQILTNIAWINKAIQQIGEVETEVYNTRGLDRDSIPASYPSENYITLPTYIGNSKNSTLDPTDSSAYFEGEEDDDDFERLVLKKAEGIYDLEIIKVDKDNTSYKLKGAKFTVTTPYDAEARIIETNSSGIAQITGLPIQDEEPDTITIQETQAPIGYNKLIGSITLNVTKELSNGEYKILNATIVDTINSGAENVSVTVDGNTIKITVKDEPKPFDLSLRKFIVAVSNDITISEDEYLIDGDLYIREPIVNSNSLNTIDNNTNKLITTSIYNHTKQPVKVKKNDYVIYMIRVYNEGERDGYAAEIKDHLPENLEYVNNDFNNENWTISEDGRTATTRCLANSKIKAAELVNGVGSGYNLDYEEVPIMCRVKSTAPVNVKITNIADITEYRDENKRIVTDRDSVKDNVNYTEGNKPNYKDNETGDYIPGQEDDDDFEKVIIDYEEGSYDLELIKVDKNNNTKKLSGAEFEITLPDNTKSNVTTDSNQNTQILDLPISEEGTDHITIKETKAPNGYKKLIDSITLNITKQKDTQSGSYKISDVSIANATSNDTENVTVSLGQNNVITIIVKDEPKSFDLSLRKYITKVNVTELTGTNSRIPSYLEDISKLNTIENGVLITTATYKHRKDPVEVKTGDIVTYNLTIYNEGEKDGRATQVIDQLPDGLKFKNIVSGNFERESYDEETNRLVLNRKSDNETNLTAYAGEQLSSETIVITCEVKKIAGASDKILTNVAWISKEIEAGETQEITTQVGRDRDSQPGVAPIVNKNNMDNYKGNSENENKDLADSNNYFKGEQDDDDFEKLILKKAEGIYDLEIIKVDKDNNQIRLQNAEFEVTLPNGSKNTYETNENGTTNIPSIKIETEGTDTLKIKETNAPLGYNKLLNNELTLKVTKVLSEEEGKYYISGNIQLLNNELDGVEVALEGNTIKLTVPNEKIEGSYNLQLIKVDEKDNNKKLAGAKFIITLPNGRQGTATTRENGIANISSINITQIETDDTITIEEIEAPKNYEKIIGKITLKVSKDISQNKYVATDVEITESTGKATASLDAENKTIIVSVPNKEIPLDFKLIKRIVAVNDKNVEPRIESVDVSKLNTLDENNKLITTGKYILNKEPVPVKKGDIVTYTFRVYNEGMRDGYVEEITEDIPEGLQFIFVDENEQATEQERAASEFNMENGWSYTDPTMKTIKTTNLALHPLINGVPDTQSHTENLIEAFGENDGTKTESDIDYREISVKMKVISDNVSGKTIRNEAAITDDAGENGEEVEDRDSTPEEWKKEDSNEFYDNEHNWPIYKEDDEDYDNIILQTFDLSLRKFIVAVGKDTNIQDKDYLRTENGKYKRAPEVDTSKLNTIDENGKMITTATYKHTKEPVKVSKNDIVVYMIRVYNESDLDGYASEIKDHLPPYLEFVKGEFNNEYGWTISEDGRTATTRYLENSKIGKISKGEQGNIVLDYKEVPIMCRVKETAKTNEKITNLADITEYLDENKDIIEDRDSDEDNVDVPADDDLPEYKDDEKGDYIPGQEDDDDFEKIIIPRYDLALRKQIISIYNTYKSQNVEYNDRFAKLDNTQKHTIYDYYDVDANKPTVVEGDIVTYSIRVYNEGEVDGKALYVTDRMPTGLEYIPDNDVNKKYGWKAYKESTAEVENAVKIGEKNYEEVSFDSKEIYMYATEYLKDTIIKAYTGEGEASYAEVQMVARVRAKKEVGEEKEYKLRNIAEIGEDDGDDEDSTPGNENEWKSEDDLDVEDLQLVEFDLALRKWVTEAIVIENGKGAVTPTGHQPYDDPEQVVKVELHRKKLNQVVVKFRYSIRVINEGQIAGYAKEVTDYIPQGLKFLAEDNEGWTDEGNNVISTKKLENTLLQPGQYADVEVILTWVNSEDNMGVMVNTAEISQDENEYGVPDIDSTPDNQKPGEDDIDDAPVMLSITTGQLRIYFTLGFVVLATVAGGVVLIKKFVL